jgi:hypothetical protein
MPARGALLRIAQASSPASLADEGDERGSVR